MSYKDLSLNRGYIEKAIIQYDSNLQVEVNDQKTRFIVFYNAKPKALIIFHYKSNGKTTIQVNQGKNKELSEEIANQVVTQCQTPSVSQGNFNIKPLTKESFDLLIEYLTEEHGVTINKTELEHSALYDVTA